MADFIYNTFKVFEGDGTIDMDDDDFYIMLLADTYAPSAAHSLLAEVVAHEIAGAGYVAGGQLLTNVVWENTAGVVKFDADDPEWDPATLTARYGLVYDFTPVSKPLAVLLDFGQNESATAAPFRVQFNEDGIFSKQ